MFAEATSKPVVSKSKNTKIPSSTSADLVQSTWAWNRQYAPPRMSGAAASLPVTASVSLYVLVIEHLDVANARSELLENFAL